MNFAEELEKMFERARNIVTELSALTEKPGTLDDETQLVVLSLIEMIGSTFIILGQELEEVNQEGVKEAFDTAQNLHERALQILAQHAKATA
ncbi:hypothetical protein [Pseudomonas serbica]|uniref:hypothetical protein n=1 Tax=Pseudomonas serbica TaxID=2965074 RepID=UPI00237A7424|nr:hypothetical protein [Pseudomonas serbica]